MADNTEIRTPLDQALANAREDESYANKFYEEFLKTDIYIPIPASHVGDDTEFARVEEGSSFRPILVENEGRSYLCVFDRLERLAAWARPRQVGYVQMAAHALLDSGGDQNWELVLNVGTPYFYEFEADEINHLRQRISRTHGEVNVSSDTKIFVGVPAEIPDGLLAALRKCLEKNYEVSRAFLGQVYIESPGEEPHMFLALRISHESASIVAAIGRDIAASVQGILPPGQVLSIGGTQDGIGKAVSQAVDAFYRT